MISKGFSATMNESMVWLLKQDNYDWWHIVDLETQEIVHEGSKD